MCLRWLPGKDSNLEWLIQSQLCYHYTTRHNGPQYSEEPRWCQPVRARYIGVSELGREGFRQSSPGVSSVAGATQTKAG